MDVTEFTEWVGRRGQVTFVEIANWLRSQDIDPGGDFSLELSTKNIVFWDGMSKPFTQLVQDALDAGSVELAACSSLIYMFDGAMLQLPIAKRPPRAGYKQPHWAPSCLSAK